MASLELEPVPSPSQCMLTDSENLTHKVIAWATDIAGYAARLPLKQARDGYLRERHRELVAGAQAEGATAHDAAIVADACVDAADYDRTARPAGGTTAGASLAPALRVAPAV